MRLEGGERAAPVRLAAVPEGLYGGQAGEESLDAFFDGLLRALSPGSCGGAGIETRPALQCGHYRRAPTAKMMADYDLDLVAAVRSRHLGRLDALAAGGKTMDACNRFGESVLHAACRRGDDEVVTHLLARGASPLVVDDFGRTPLHDACWTSEPSLAVVTMLLARDPGMIHLADARGATPLAYVRREHFPVWRAFLAHYVAAAATLVEPKPAPPPGAPGRAGWGAPAPAPPRPPPPSRPEDFGCAGSDVAAASGEGAEKNAPQPQVKRPKRVPSKLRE